MSLMGCDNQTRLHRAVQHDSLEIVKLLLARSANPNSIDSGGRTPLSLAVLRNRIQIAKILLEHGADVNRRSGVTTLLHLAVRDQHNTLVRVLLEWKADINALDNKYRTPLTVAVCDFNIELVQELLQSRWNARPLSKNQLRPAVLESLKAKKEVYAIITNAPVPITGRSVVENQESMDQE
ncbi:hypothetical protein LTR84_005179 [Exophiala bonariae]|uniref:Uncharacterized protein n=1 Tax=Exophiala bonariae TaxID=1690606 RepID=A0AAV9NPZ0_9EURO|nr:hypothetical protein LTR84_005179 [Exophiala bonariae]